MSRAFSRLIAAALLASAGLIGSAFGQATDSSIVGIVKDPAGAFVSGAAITASNKDTGVKYSTISNIAGEYRLNNVPVGRYDIVATATGFAGQTVAGVQTDLNHTISTNFTLQISSVATTVDVVESSAPIDTSTSQVQTTFDARQAVDLPAAGISKVIDGAGMYNLSLLGAGVSSSGGVGEGTGPSVAGQRPENNSFNIDGVSNNSAYATGPEVYVSNEAIAEMNVQQNQFSPEFGGASGGVFNVVLKTGTNHAHGSLYEYLQNRNLNSVDYSTVIGTGQRTNPRLDNNRVGGTIGGPIRKNKVFYFGNFEYNPLGQNSTPGQPVFAPTAAGLAILNNMAGLSKTNLDVFEKYVPVAPLAAQEDPISVNGVNIPDGQLTFNSPNYTNSYHAIAAVDYDISSADQLRGRFVYDRSVGIDANAQLPVFYQPSPTINKMVAVSEFHNFSPSMENELRVSYRRNYGNTSAGNYVFPGLSAFPNISLDDLGLQIGPDPNSPSGSISNTSMAVDNLTKTWGKHSFKIGYSLTDVIITGTFVQRSRGDYDYASLEQFLLDEQPSGSAFGTPSSGERSVGAANGVPFGFLQNAAYFNDDWKIRSNLTLNLGIRYEYVTVPVGSRAQQYSSLADVPGVITFADPKSTKNDWSPRVGFAYAPGAKGEWSIRGGVARSFDNTYINLNQNSAPLYYQTTVDVNDANPVNNFLANGGISGALPPQGTPAEARAAIGSYTWDQRRPYALTGTLGVQRLLAKDYTVEARYMYTKGVHLWNQTRLNVVSPVSPSTYIPTYFTMPSAATLANDKLTLGGIEAVIPPGGTVLEPWNDLAVYGFQNALVGYEPWGNSRYNGLALQVTKRYSKNFYYTVAYTWSHAFDDSTATNFSTILSPRRAQDFQDQRAEWATSALDHRQRLTITPGYDFRPFQGGKWILKNIVGNWTVSGTYTFESPEYATVQDGIDANLNNDATGDRTIINPAGVATAGSDVTGINSAGQAVASGSPYIVAYVANNPNARYVIAGLGALANSGRNTFPLGRTNNIDLALMKRIAIRERTSFSIGAQFFNLFNHSQFTGGFLSDVSPASTALISRSFLIPNSPTFGQYDNFLSSNSRVVQLVAKVVF